MEELQQVIINAAISIITILIGVAVDAFRKWTLEKRAELETKKSATQLEILDAVARSAVNFVEQVYKEARGDEKLMRALVAAQKELKVSGIDVSDDQLRVFIEAAVKTANDSWKGVNIL